MAKSRARKLADIIVGAGVDIDGNLTFDGGSTSEDLTFADGDKANFGDSSDLQIFHDGNNSRITDNGTGALILRGANSVEIEDVSGEDMAIFRSNGAVELYHNNSKKIETTSSGVSITGAVTSTTGFITGANTRVQSSSGMLFLTGVAAIPFALSVAPEDRNANTLYWLFSRMTVLVKPLLPLLIRSSISD